MHEPFLFSKKKSPGGGYIYYLDFEDEPIGSRELNDLSPSKLQLPLVNASAIGANEFGVVDDPIIGKAFRFDGNGYFFADNNPLSSFTIGSYLIELGFYRQAGIDYCPCLFSTGNYTNGYMDRGVSLTIDQFPQTALQLFVFDGYSYDRHFINEPFRSGYNELVIERTSSARLKNLTTGRQDTYPTFANIADSYWSVGGTRGATAAQSVPPFKGLLKYLRIKKL
jgi:hypothetical protein